jgi:hypothetical protein
VGVDVVAFDIAPAPAAQNRWFAGTRAWHPVHHGDHDVVGHHAERTLLVVWPTKNEMWAATAVERYHDAGGECLVYVGEGPGGRTGDDVFHALLGELTMCVECEYGSTTSPCICSVEARWRRSETVALPHWPDYHDDLDIYTRRLRRARPRWRRGASTTNASRMTRLQTRAPRARIDGSSTTRVSQPTDGAGVDNRGDAVRRPRRQACRRCSVSTFGIADTGCLARSESLSSVVSTAGIDHTTRTRGSRRARSDLASRRGIYGPRRGSL